MNWTFPMRIRKITDLIVVLSIISLTFMALLPWISVTESSDSGEIVTVYDFAMMEKSDDQQITGTVEDLELITILPWVVIIFGIVSFVGIMLYISEKYSLLAQLLIVSGCATIILNLLIFVFLWNWMKNIETMYSFSATTIGSTGISYAHLPLITSAISFTCSVFYTIFVAHFSIKRFIGFFKHKNGSDKQFDQRLTIKQTPDRETYSMGRETKVLEKPMIDKKSKYFDKKIGYEKTSATVVISESDKEKHEESEKPLAHKQPFPADKPVSEEQPSEPVQSETLEEPETKEPPTSSMFEQALTSAIKKRQPGTQQKEEEERQPEKKKISVRCPECENIFSVERTGDVLKIKCPRCGKEGLIK